MYDPILGERNAQVVLLRGATSTGYVSVVSASWASGLVSVDST